MLEEYLQELYKLVNNMLINGYVDKRGRDVSDLCRGQLKVIGELISLKQAILRQVELEKNKNEKGAS